MTSLTSATTAVPSRTAGPWRALPIILLGTFLAQASFFVVNVALPSIGHTLGADNAVLQLVIAGYSVSYAGLLVAAGRLGDRYGRRRLFMIGLLVFAVASLLSALAGNGFALAGARLITGVAAGLIVPQVLGTIQATFVDRERQQAIGYFAATAGVACVLGQLIGGFGVSLDEQYGWRLVFLLFAPSALLVGLIGHRLMPESRGARSPVDGLGAGALILALGLVIVPLSVGRDAGWPPWTWISLAAGLLVTAGFLADQRRRERAGGSPLLPPSLFSMVVFRRGLLALTVFFLSMGGFFLVTAITMQEGLGIAPFGSSLALAPYAVVFLVFSLLIPRWVGRFGGPAVITVGGLLLALAYGVVVAEALLDYAHLNVTVLAATFALVGAAQALVMVPLVGSVLAQIPVDRAGFAAGVMSTVQQAAIAIGVGLLGTVFFSYAGGPVGGDGWRMATVVVFGVQAVLGLAVAWLAPRLTRVRGTGPRTAGGRSGTAGTR